MSSLGAATGARSLAATVAVAWAVVGCGNQSAPAPLAQSGSAAEPERAGPVASVIFSSAPLALEELAVKVGRTGMPTGIDFHAKAIVKEAKGGRVTLPIRVACRFRDHRVVDAAEIASAYSKTFSLEKVSTSDVFATPLEMGWLGRPDACEVTIRAEPNTKAKESMQPLEEQFCWTVTSNVQGSCGFPPTALPTAAFALHDITAQMASVVEIHAHVQTRDADPPRGAVHVDAQCAGGATDRGFATTGLRHPFKLVAGDSEAVRVTLFDGKDRPKGDCTLKFSWAAWNESDSVSPRPPIELGTWCAADDGGSARVPPPVKPGACGG